MIIRPGPRLHERLIIIFLYNLYIFVIHFFNCVILNTVEQCYKHKCAYLIHKSYQKYNYSGGAIDPQLAAVSGHRGNLCGGGGWGGYTSVFNFSMKMGSVSGPYGNLPPWIGTLSIHQCLIKMRKGG